MLLPYGDDIHRRIFPLIPIALIAINLGVLFHAEMLISSDDQQFSATTRFFCEFGLQYQAVSTGKLSSLLTYMFLHDGVLHLLGNMIVLWAIGRSLCLLLGRVNVLVLYFACGVVAGLTHVLSTKAGLPLVGASGAVAGLIGAYAIAFGLLSRVKFVLLIGFVPVPFKVPAMFFGVLWIAVQIFEASTDLSGSQNVSWIAHLGGFACGALMMFVARTQWKEQLYRLTSRFDSSNRLPESQAGSEIIGQT